MKQVLQSIRDGKTEVVDVPCPQIRPGHLLIETHLSLISPGTERMLLEFGNASWIGKARSQPDKVRMVLEKVKTDGVLPTLDAVRSKLDQPIAMGYSNVGTVRDIGTGVTEFGIGDRVVSNGPHAQVVCVPKNLCAKVPDGVPDETAVFTVMGAIALQGIRLAEPTIGETFAVIGLGLIGLLTVQLLKAQGCRVIGIDMNAQRLKLAEQFGAETVDLSRDEDPIAAAVSFARGRGVDGVLVAAATKSNLPLRQAAQMSRKRGRIVLLGVAEIDIPRSDFYEKELSFQVSCSYGPGRYDSSYEEQGHDYPLPFVRWTLGRNFEAVLDTMHAKRIATDALVSHRFEIDQATQAYELIGGSEPSLGVILSHHCTDSESNADLLSSTVRVWNASGNNPRQPSEPQVGFLGAGSFATQVLIPAFQKAGAQLVMVASAGGVNGHRAARKFGFAEATTDPNRLFESSDVDTIVIATRHDTHADFVTRALAAGKNVFVEKPLALNEDELQRVVSAHCSDSETGRNPSLMVGFNRRFAPHVKQIAMLLDGVDEPKSFVMTVNAGDIPADHWTQDSSIGGGRIIGEACHFIDLLRHLCGHPIVGVQATMIGQSPAVAVRHDKMSFTLQFADGSFGTVHYLANGHRAVPKERLEVFCNGRVIQLDNFRKLVTFGFPQRIKNRLWRQDKGHNAEVAAFVHSIRNGEPSPIPFDQAVEATRVSFQVVTAAESGQPIIVSADSQPTGHHRDDSIEVESLAFTRPA